MLARVASSFLAKRQLDSRLLSRFTTVASGNANACRNSKKILEVHYNKSIRHCFHTSEKRLVPPPIVLLVLRPLMKVGAALAGRGFRKWWRSLPKEKRKYFWKKIEANMGKIVVGSGIVGLCAGGFYVSHLQATPISMRRRFMLFSPDVYDSLAKDMFEEHIMERRNQILPATHPAYKFVSVVAERLLLGNKDLPQICSKNWSVTIINDPAFNAFVIPSGNIFVFTGMLTVCDGPDQLACVLGHEMAHAVLGHAVETLGYSHLIDMVLMVVLAMIWAILPTDVTALVAHWLTNKISQIVFELPYSRMLEKEADEVGLELAAKACFDIRQSPVFWSKLNALQQLNEESEVEWLSTHPMHETRAETLENAIPKAIEKRKDCKCPPLPLQDPRNKIQSYKKWVEEERKKDLSKFAVYLDTPAPITMATKSSK